MVVGCIALGVALGGTSVAAIQALPKNSVGTKQLKNNAVTSPKVKNNAISGADVNEGTLGTVPSATNATNATNAANAANAANATNATNAGNAGALNGEGPAVYLDRVAQGAVGGVTAIPVPAVTTTQLVPPVSLTVPAGVNYVQVDAQAVLSGASAASNWIIWFQQDGACALSGTSFNNRPFGRLQTSSDQQSLFHHLVVGVSAGVHTFRLCALSSLAANAYDPVLIAHTIPRGATGGASLGEQSGDSPGTGRPLTPSSALTPAGG
jgi:hypothetical protein